jgi:hypothetical protein
LTDSIRKPDFLIVGAQKAGTTWLWDMLDNHPGTDLPKRKEPHFFASSENFSKGLESYWPLFNERAPDRLTGEASTSYLSDRVAFFYNDENRLEYDNSLPLVPELVAKHVPDAKLIVSLRDPVARAISAYFHYMREGKLPVLSGLTRTVTEHPRLRILELGDYAKHLAPWLATFPRDRVLVLVFEEDIVANPGQGLEKLYGFLDLDKNYAPDNQHKKANKSWNWTQTVASYYAGPFKGLIHRRPLAGLLANNDWLGRYAVRKADIQFLRDYYLPSRDAVAAMAQSSLSTWTYGEKLLQ